MIKLIGKICLLIPFIISALNLQNLAALYLGESTIRNMAYLNLGLVILGMFFFLKERKKTSHTVVLWFWFFGLYYTFGLLANIMHGNPVELLRHSIPLAYLISFSIFLSIEDNHKLMGKVIAITFFIGCTILIIFSRLNFDLDYKSIYEYSLDRAGGVYGDANQSALVALLTFVFIRYLFTPTNKFQKLLKFSALLITLYALILTFSKTGFVIFLIVLCLIYHRMFDPRRILITGVILVFGLTSIFSFLMQSDFLSPVQKDRILNVAEILTFQTDKVDYSGRNVLLENMMNYIYQNPIFGNGVNFSVSIHGHNTIMGVWADAGIFTFLFFLIMLFRHFFMSMKSTTENRYFLLSIFFIITIYMLSLQSIITEPYLLVVFVWMGYQMSIENKLRANLI